MKWPWQRTRKVRLEVDLACQPKPEALQQIVQGCADVMKDAHARGDLEPDGPEWRIQIRTLEEAQ